MIVFGTFGVLTSVLYNSLENSIFNINSPVPQGIPLRHIFPVLNDPTIVPGEYSYDLCLTNHILTDNAAFYEVLSILYADYQGRNVYVLIDNQWWSIIYIESLIKFIQARYGCEVNLINELSDLETCKETSFSILGRQQFQADKERLVYSNFNGFMIAEDVSDDE